MFEQNAQSLEYILIIYGIYNALFSNNQQLHTTVIIQASSNINFLYMHV